MFPWARRFSSLILAIASALPSTRATTQRSSTSSLPPQFLFHAKASLSSKSKWLVVIQSVLQVSNEILHESASDAPGCRPQVLVSSQEMNPAEDRVAAVCYAQPMANRSFAADGGTPGGLGHFMLGVIMAYLGVYFLVNQVRLVGSFWSFFGANTFGLTLVPMLFGVGLLFWNGRTAAGSVLTLAGSL